MTRIRLATLHDLAWSKRCARAAYEPYVPLIGREPAPMHSDFKGAIEAGHLSILEVSDRMHRFATSSRTAGRKRLHRRNHSVNTAEADIPQRHFC